MWRSRRGRKVSTLTSCAPTIRHPMADILLSYAESGCTVECGPDWTEKHTSEAIKQGPHASAKDLEAAKYSWGARGKEAQGYCTIHDWNTLKPVIPPPPQLKLSHIAAIPHKSRAHRLILDISFGIWVGGYFKNRLMEHQVLKPLERH